MMFYAQRLFFLLPALWAAFAAAAQPTVQAEYTPYYSGKDPTANYIEYRGGCSLYCLIGPTEITASSELPSNPPGAYSATKLFDFDTSTAWAEGARGPGAGTSITFEFDAQELSLGEFSPSIQLTQIELMNGYYKTEELWRANARVKQMAVFADGKLHCFINWLDKRDLQTAEIPALPFPKAPRFTLRFVVMEVYPGDKYEDLCITELGFDGKGAH